MASIIRVDVNNTTLYLEGMAKLPMQLVETQLDFTPLPTPLIQSGGVESIGGVLYIVDSGNVEPTGFVSTQNQYLYLAEVGDGTATATFTVDVPTWDSSKLGFYNGTSKCIGHMQSSGAFFTFYRFYNFDNLELDYLIVNQLKANHNLTCTGTSTFAGATFVTNNLTVTGATTSNDVIVNNDLTVSGKMTGPKTTTGVASSGFLSYIKSALGSESMTVQASGIIIDIGGAGPYPIYIIASVYLNPGLTAATIRAYSTLTGTELALNIPSVDPTGYVIRFCI